MHDLAVGINRQEMLMQITRIAGAPVGSTVSILFGSDPLGQVTIRHEGHDYVVSRDLIASKEVFTITEELIQPSGQLPTDANAHALNKDQMLKMVAEWAGDGVANGVIETLAALNSHKVRVHVDGQEVQIIEMGNDLFSVFIDRK